MSDSIQRLSAGGGADSQRRPAEPPLPVARRRRVTDPAVHLTANEALARLRTAARDAGLEVHFSLRAVDGRDMVVATLPNGTILRSVPLAEALHLAATLCDTVGGLYQGSF